MLYVKLNPKYRLAQEDPFTPALCRLIKEFTNYKISPNYTMDKKYEPIACGLYDELEVRALKKQKVWLTYVIPENQKKKINCVIIDLFSKNKIEYLKTDGGIIIRLDDILEVDNISFSQSC